jgi:hypothetical protein
VPLESLREAALNLEDIVGRLGEPRLVLTGAAHWRLLREGTGIEVPSDFRRFCDAYGPGLLNGLVCFFHPSAGATRLGDYVNTRMRRWPPEPGVHDIPIPFGIGPGRLMPVARSFSGVDLLFRVEDGDPDGWHACAYAGDVDEYIDFGVGFGEWLEGYLDGAETIESFFAGSGDDPSYFESTLAGPG